MLEDDVGACGRTASSTAHAIRREPNGDARHRRGEREKTAAAPGESESGRKNTIKGTLKNTF
jgi:hypothetical protein